MKTIVRISFRITEFDCSHDSITAALSLVPTKVWHKGDPMHPKARLTHKNDGWEFGMEFEWTESFYYSDRVRELVQRIHPSHARLKQVCARYTATLSCGLTIRGDDRPDLFLEADIIQQLSDLGAGIDVDIYAVD